MTRARPADRLAMARVADDVRAALDGLLALLGVPGVDASLRGWSALAARRLAGTLATAEHVAGGEADDDPEHAVLRRLAEVDALLEVRVGAVARAGRRLASTTGARREAALRTLRQLAAREDETRRERAALIERWSEVRAQAKRPARRARRTA